MVSHMKFIEVTTSMIVGSKEEFRKTLINTSHIVKIENRTPFCVIYLLDKTTIVPNEPYSSIRSYVYDGR